MTSTTNLTVGKQLDDAELAFFYGASGSDKCVVTISKGSGEPTMTGNCEGVTVKEK